MEVDRNSYFSPPNRLNCVPDIVYVKVRLVVKFKGKELRYRYAKLPISVIE